MGRIFTYHIQNAKLRQFVVAQALANGAALHGDKVEIVEGYKGPVPGADGTILLGVGDGASTLGTRTVFDDYRALGKHVIFMDKAYTRHEETYRVSVNAFQPSEYVMREKRPNDRVELFGLRMYDRPNVGSLILFDGASQKYCDWFHLGDAVTWGVNMVEKIAQHTKLPIVYRPRSAKKGVKIPGLPPSINVSYAPLQQDLDRTRVLVSHGGNIGFDAALYGVPNFIIHDSIVRPIAETYWAALDKPRVPDNTLKHQWLSNVMYCQWTIEEFTNGSAWPEIVRWMD